MYKAFKYRIYPNKPQRELIEKTFGCCRYVYNRILAMRIEQCESGVKVQSFGEFNAMLKEWKLDPETEWLKDVDSQALGKTVQTLEQAHKNFFRAPGKIGFPKFKSKRSSRKRYTTTRIQIRDGNVRLAKVGIVKTKMHRPIEGRPISATVELTPSGKYFIAIRCTDCDCEQLPKTDNAIGIDCGLENLVITSESETFDNPRYFKTSKKKLAKAQRRLSRKVGARKGERQSNNYKKQKLRVAKIYEKISNQRWDNLHKISTQLINENQVIATETLFVKNMMKNHCLAQAISDAGWSGLCAQLSYKAMWYGRTFIQINTFFPSSKLCSTCGEKSKQVTDLSVRRWTCENYGTSHHRDVNAAKNILIEGLKMIRQGLPESNACGENISQALTAYSDRGLQTR